MLLSWCRADFWIWNNFAITKTCCYYYFRFFLDHNWSASQPVSAAKFNAAGARPTLIYANFIYEKN